GDRSHGGRDPRDRAGARSGGREGGGGGRGLVGAQVRAKSAGPINQRPRHRSAGAAIATLPCTPSGQRAGLLGEIVVPRGGLVERNREVSIRLARSRLLLGTHPR